MKKVVEYRARAALCRRLSVCEPANRAYWLAEAESWSRRAQDEISFLFTECNLIPPAGDAGAGESRLDVDI